MEKIRIVAYSEKSFAIFGDTKPIKDELKALGGKFNPNLTDPDNGERVAGWIFSVKKYDQVMTTLNIH